MPRARLKRLYPIALSVDALAEALGVHRRLLLAAVRAGELPVYQLGTKRRVLVCDAVEYVRTYWKKG